MYGALRFKYTAPIPVPASVTISGALRVTAFDTPNRALNAPLKAWSNTVDDDHVTTGTVQRIQLVSILIDFARGPHAGWSGPQPIAGTEWFYDLVQPPEQLHHYLPGRHDDEPEPRVAA
ncbi:hypothetical protein [Rhodococcus sp. IEGM1428]|uniref:hypothetical protein n=1 Tax=Rhodococcus sp. IEGM1428 TaxID=3392191 RepID=UPI003D0B0170